MYTCLGLYMVAQERQAQNRERMLAEALKAMDSGGNSGEGAWLWRTMSLWIRNILQNFTVITGFSLCKRFFLSFKTSCWKEKKNEFGINKKLAVWSCN